MLDLRKMLFKKNATQDSSSINLNLIAEKQDIKEQALVKLKGYVNSATNKAKSFSQFVSQGANQMYGDFCTSSIFVNKYKKPSYKLELPPYLAGEGVKSFSFYIFLFMLMFPPLAFIYVEQFAFLCAKTAISYIYSVPAFEEVSTKDLPKSNRIKRKEANYVQGFRAYLDENNINSGALTSSELKEEIRRYHKSRTYRHRAANHIKSRRQMKNMAAVSSTIGCGTGVIS